MTSKALKLNYGSVDQFLRHYEHLSKGKIFLRSKNPLPTKTLLILQINVPGIENTVPLEAIVLKSLDPGTADRLGKPTGMVIGFQKPLQEALIPLNTVLAANEHYRAIVKLSIPDKDVHNAAPGLNKAPSPPVKPKSSHQTMPAKAVVSSDANGKNQIGRAVPASDNPLPELSMDWIRNAIAQEDVVREEEDWQDVSPALSEKKELTPQERSRVKPVADFIMDLTKAMLRTGYYDSDHPGAENAKRGLYESFLSSLSEASEIMLTHQETKEKIDILITGILSEPVNVRTLVGAGMAELFLPKLSEFFNRKGLVTFAIRKTISPQHFEKFVDIMSDPTADQGDQAQLGEMLSSALVENGITEISTVFMDDIIALEMNLPWRVEMAIQRLVKDLKVLPMFRTESDENIKQMKLQIIQDIIRPLNHPEFLKDLIINCYVIARHLDNVESEDVEIVIIEAFPLESLLPTSRYIFDELRSLKELGTADPDNPSVKRRFTVVKRILKWVARRLVLEDVSGAQRFLEQLYENGLLKFEELPADVQYLVNTTKMARDIQNHPDRYADRLLQASSEEDTGLVLKCFRRILPQLLEEQDWMSIGLIAQATAACEQPPPQTADISTGSFSPVLFIFEGQIEKLVEIHERADENDGSMIESIFRHVGTPGIEVLSSVLSQSPDRLARKAAMQILEGLGDLTRDWVNRILDDPESKWYVKRNALILLDSLDKETQDSDRVSKLLKNANARVRDEALKVTVNMRAQDAESQVIRAMEDRDEKVRWRALNALPEFAPVSDQTMSYLLGVIKAEIPVDSEAAARHYRKATQFVRAIGAMKKMRDPAGVEETILELAQKLAANKKRLFKRLKKNQPSDHQPLLQASLTALATVGSRLSLSSLHQLAGGKGPTAETARKAAAVLEQRLAEEAVGS